MTLLRGFGVFSDPIGLEKELYTTPHPDYRYDFFLLLRKACFMQVSAGGGQQERTEIMKIRTDRRRREQGSQDASEQDPDQSGSPREEAREDRGKKKGGAEPP